VGKLFLLFTLVPFIEVYILIRVGSHIGFWETVCIVIMTGMIGAWLARQQGSHLFRKLLQDIQQGRLPADTILDGVLVLIGSVLLITPGFITDIFGIGLIFPPTRLVVRKILQKRITAKIKHGMSKMKSGAVHDDAHPDFWKPSADSKIIDATDWEVKH
jgi:UPF0716 protein FxsA